MTTKVLIRQRLSTAIGKKLSQAEFSHFFVYFCEREHREDLKRCHALDETDLLQFSRFCGYDLRFPIPLPLLIAN